MLKSHSTGLKDEFAWKFKKNDTDTILAKECSSSWWLLRPEVDMVKVGNVMFLSILHFFLKLWSYHWKEDFQLVYQKLSSRRLSWGSSSRESSGLTACPLKLWIPRRLHPRGHKLEASPLPTLLQHRDKRLPSSRAISNKPELCRRYCQDPMLKHGV